MGLMVDKVPVRELFYGTLSPPVRTRWGWPPCGGGLPGRSWRCSCSWRMNWHRGHRRRNCGTV